MSQDAGTAQDSAERVVVLKNKYGLHARPATLIAQTAKPFNCEISLAKEGTRVDAKSIFDLLTLNAPYGTRLVLEAPGNSAAEAVAQLAALFESNFAAEGEATP